MMKSAITTPVSKSTLRQETERQVAEFLKRGGTIQVLPTRKAKSGARTWKK